MSGEDPQGDHEGSNAVAGTRSEAIAVARREEGADPPRRNDFLPSREEVGKPGKVGAGGNASPHYFVRDSVRMANGLGPGGAAARPDPPRVA